MDPIGLFLWRTLTNTGLNTSKQGSLGAILEACLPRNIVDFITYYPPI